MVKVEELEAEEEPWLTLGTHITEAREEVIRFVAGILGYETLRGFHMALRANKWDYYDVLRFWYGEVPF